MATIKLFKPVPRAAVFLRDMTSSYTFMDDVYLLNIPALKGRLENWANHIHATAEQPICLSAKFANFQEDPEVAISICSVGAKLSELARGADDSGIVNIQLGDKKLGEIEWLTQATFDLPLFLTLFVSFLLISAIVAFSAYIKFREVHITSSTHDDSATADLLRSLHRIMGSNRRTMALHDNWVYGERAHPYINFTNLDGSKLRLRASLSDIAMLFPKARYINRSALVNTGAGVHQVSGTNVILRIKTGDIEFGIDPSYKESLLS